MDSWSVTPANRHGGSLLAGTDRPSGQSFTHRGRAVLTHLGHLALSGAGQARLVDGVLVGDGGHRDVVPLPADVDDGRAAVPLLPRRMVREQYLVAREFPESLVDCLHRVVRADLPVATFAHRLERRERL